MVRYSSRCLNKGEGVTAIGPAPVIATDFHPDLRTYDAEIGCRLLAGRFLYLGEQWQPFGDGVYDPLSAMGRHAVVPICEEGRDDAGP